MVALIGIRGMRDQGSLGTFVAKWLFDRQSSARCSTCPDAMEVTLASQLNRGCSRDSFETRHCQTEPFTMGIAVVVVRSVSVVTESLLSLQDWKSRIPSLTSGELLF